MDRDSTEAAWAHIPYDVLNRVLGYLSRKQSWRRVASTFHLVNRHWRDAIRQHFVILNPRENRPFNFFRDVNSFSQFSNLHTLILRNVSFRAAAEWVLHLLEHLGLEMLGEINVPVPQKLAELKKLVRLKIENPDKLEPFLSVFCSVCPLQCLFLKQGCLNNELLKKMREMSTLKTLQLRSVDTVTDILFVDFLEAMDQLEAVELSFADGLWLGSVAIFTRLNRLKYLRISPKNFDFKGLSALSNLQHLRTLILDRRVNGDGLDLSCLSQVTHLSINCPSMPLWIPNMHDLQSLALQTSDDFKNEQRQLALTSIASRLKALQLIAPNANGFFVREVISEATDLEVLKLTGHIISCDSIQNLEKLKEVSVRAKNDDQSSRMIRVLPSLGRLLYLESLTVAVHNLHSLAFVFLKEPNTMKDTLVKLVADSMSTKAVDLVIYHLHRLRDLRLLNGKFELSVFEFATSTDLPLLKNLCLSSSRPYANSFDIRALLRFPIVTRLEHLGFKGEYPPDRQMILRSFSEKHPQVLADENLDWEPDEFQILC